MKKISLLLIIIIALGIFSFNRFPKQNNEPWKQSQLLQPAVLANQINNPSVKQPIIYSVGFGAGIKNSIIEGPMRDSVNLMKWKQALEKLPRNAEIVIYCGCCPFEHCPNIRPAFKLLNEMGFTNQKLLNIEHNIKKDWIDQKYPTE